MTENTFPAAYRQEYPSLARVFDESAVVNDSVFTTYLQAKRDERLLITLVEDIFRLLEYSLIPVDSWHDEFDIVIRKGDSTYPIYVTQEGKPSLTALQELTAANTSSTVPHSILVSAAVPTSERTKRVANHDGVRVIDCDELRELVQGAITRLSEPAPSPEPEKRKSSTNSIKIGTKVDHQEGASPQSQVKNHEVPDGVDNPSAPDSTATEKTQLTDSSTSDQPTEIEPDVSESSSFIRSVKSIEDTSQNSSPVMLKISEHLMEDSRRHVFRAKTVDGEPVQLDVWDRHLGEFDWEPDTWYLFEALRGQHWTVDGEAGVTVSTTPHVTVTQRDSLPDTDVTT